MSEKNRLEIARQVRTLCDLIDAEQTATDTNILNLLGEIETLKQLHVQRESDLLEANNREVERRRKAEAANRFFIEYYKEEYPFHEDCSSMQGYTSCRYCGSGRSGVRWTDKELESLEHDKNCPYDYARKNKDQTEYQ